MNAIPKILIVDDEAVGRQLLEAILMHLGYELVFAKDGNEAVRSVMENRPDLILLDIMMPELNGYEVCRMIRSEPDRSSIPVIMITALDDRDSRLKGLEAGANDYISKPYDRSEVIAKIKNMLSNRSSAKVPEKKEEKNDPFVKLFSKYLSSPEQVISRWFESFFYLPRPETLLNISESGSSCFFSVIRHSSSSVETPLLSLILKRDFNENPSGKISGIIERSIKTFEGDMKEQNVPINEKMEWFAGVREKNGSVMLGGFNHTIFYSESNHIKAFELNNTHRFQDYFNQPETMDFKKGDRIIIFSTVFADALKENLKDGFDDFILRLFHKNTSEQKKDLTDLIEQALNHSSLHVFAAGIIF